jgi:hypothetical protein
MFGWKSTKTCGTQPQKKPIEAMPEADSIRVSTGRGSEGKTVELFDCNTEMMHPAETIALFFIRSEYPSSLLQFPGNKKS